MDKNRQHAGLKDKKKNNAPNNDWNDDQMDLYFKLQSKKQK